MPAAMLAVGLLAGGTGGPVSIQYHAVLAQQFVAARRHVLVDDVATKRGGAHRVDLEQADLFRRQAQLGEAVENDHTQLGMKRDLEGIDSHSSHETGLGGSMPENSSPAIVVQRKSGCNLKTLNWLENLPVFPLRQGPRTGTITPPP